MPGFLIAEIDRLSPSVRVVGSALAIGIACLAIVMRTRPAKNELEMHRPWRRIVLATFVLSSISMLLGLNLDPAKFPIAFVGSWLFVWFLMAIALIFSGFDLWVTGERNRRARIKHLELRRKQIVRGSEGQVLSRRPTTSNDAGPFLSS